MIAIPATTYKSPAGVLALMPNAKSLYWYGCREQFHRASARRKDKTFLFAFAEGEKEGIINFIKAVEDKIAVPTRCQLQDTSTPTVLCIAPGPWWSKQNMRLSFLTILLRAGRKFTGDNFQNALFSVEYTKETKSAVDRFLDGYTWFNGSAGMWTNTFSMYNNTKKIDFVEKSLTKENAKVSSKSLKEAKHLVRTATGESLALLIARALDRAVEEGYEAKQLAESRGVKK